MLSKEDGESLIASLESQKFSDYFSESTIESLVNEGPNHKDISDDKSLLKKKDRNEAFSGS